MKSVFVGDIHGKWELVEEALSLEGKKYFVGDFIDSWNRSPEDHKKCYDLYFEAHKKGEARAAFGNHELSYLMDRHMCSGWKPEHNALMQSIKEQLYATFEPYILVDPDFLVTHGGLTAPLWEQAGLTLETLPKWLDDNWKVDTSPVHYIGYCRGGMQKYGGIFWSTFGEDFEPINGLTQVFGHTRQRQGIQQENSEDGTPNFCIDCLDWKKEFLILDV